MKLQVPSTPAPQYRWIPGSDPQTETEIYEFFHSAEIEQLKELMCDIGRRLWEKDYVDGNGGNLTIRVGDNIVLCTPTQNSKGFMTPEMMTLVDMEGRQIAGSRLCTSEILTHLGVMKSQPDAMACCHAHPPTATGFAVAGLTPQRFLTPEAEVFLGQIGLSEYRTPGSAANGKEVGRVAAEHVCVLMRNHGVMTRGNHLELAYWRMENIETICRTYLAGRAISGRDSLPQISGDEMKYILKIYEQVSAQG